MFSGFLRQSTLEAIASRLEAIARFQSAFVRCWNIMALRSLVELIQMICRSWIQTKCGTNIYTKYYMKVTTVGTPKKHAVLSCQPVSAVLSSSPKPSSSHTVFLCVTPNISTISLGVRWVPCGAVQEASTAPHGDRHKNDMELLMKMQVSLGCGPFVGTPHGTFSGKKENTKT